MCVQDIDVQCVLQFTLIHAAGCALHRHTSRVIHRLELYRVTFVTNRQLSAARARRSSVHPRKTTTETIAAFATRTRYTEIDRTYVCKTRICTTRGDRPRD